MYPNNHFCIASTSQSHPLGIQQPGLHYVLDAYRIPYLRHLLHDSRYEDLQPLILRAHDESVDRLPSYQKFAIPGRSNLSGRTPLLEGVQCRVPVRPVCLALAFAFKLATFSQRVLSEETEGT